MFELFFRDNSLLHYLSAPDVSWVQLEGVAIFDLGKCVYGISSTPYDSEVLVLEESTVHYSVSMLL